MAHRDNTFTESVPDMAVRIEMIGFFHNNPECSVLASELAKRMKRNLAQVLRQVEELEKLDILEVKEERDGEKVYVYKPPFSVFEAKKKKAGSGAITLQLNL